MLRRLINLGGMFGLLLLLARSALAQGDGIRIVVENDFADARGRPQAVTLKLWSEKPVNPQNSVVERQIRPRGVTEIGLVSPDRYTVEVTWQKHVFRTVPMQLKLAASNNRGKVLKIGQLAAAAEDMALPPAMQLGFGDRGKPLYAAMAESLESFQEPSNWLHMLTFRNQLSDASGKPVSVKVTLRSARPLKEPYTPGSQTIAGGQAGDFSLISPDTFSVELAFGDEALTVSDLPLKEALAESRWAGPAGRAKPYLLLKNGANGKPILSFENVLHDRFYDIDSERSRNLFETPPKAAPPPQ